MNFYAYIINYRNLLRKSQGIFEKKLKKFFEARKIKKARQKEQYIQDFSKPYKHLLE